MKSKIASLSKNSEFKSILDGKKISNKYSTIFFKTLNGKNIKKFNIIFFLKKKIGNAVSRNKIKRRLKNIMNEAYNKIDINLNYSYLLIAKKIIFDDKYADIRKSLLTNFKKIK